jgi:DNA-binding NarL/FixJ family response regulator
VQQVLVVETHILIGAGIHSFLAGEADLEVTGISPGNQAELIREIRRLRPDIVVLDEDSRLAEPTHLLAWLKDYPRLRLVVVSANDNRVCIYDKQQILTSQASDLLGIIRDY